MNFEFIDDIAIADVAFRARGATLEEVFQAAAAATANVMVCDLESIARIEVRQVELRETRLDMLLFDFLQEIIFYKDAEGLLLLPDEMEMGEEGEEKFLRARLSGEFLDMERHPLNADVKAVTMHRFSLHQGPEGWQAEVILDI